MAVSSTEISVQWDGLDPCRHVNGRIDTYRVQYTEVASGTVQSINEENRAWNVVDAVALLTGLTPFTEYTIRVAAINEEGDIGPYSDPDTERTLEGRKSLIMDIKFWI